MLFRSTIADGGRVNVGRASVDGLVKLYSTGTVNLNTGGTLEADRIELAPGAMSNFNTQPSSTLQVNRLVGFGPNPVFYGKLSLGSPNGSNLGRITIASGESLAAESILVGSDPFNNATLTVESGGVVVTTGSAGMVLTSVGRLTGTGEVITAKLENGGLVSPGSLAGSLTIGGDYLQLATGHLEIEIGGTSPAQYDKLDMVVGWAALDGFLDVSLIDPLGGGNIFAPRAGDSFEILTADNGLVGTQFATQSGDLPALTGGLFWDIVYGNTFVRLDVLTPFTADFDRDGDVDGDDQAQWQGDFGINGDSDADSDADGDGDSDGADLLAWQRNFGTGVPSAANSQAVPEPATYLLFIIGLTCCTSLPKTTHVRS